MNDNYDTFNKLPKAKQDAILTAAFEEFGDKGYEQASTNIIASKAGISKGLIFHYFKNKEGLYIFLMDRAIATIKEVTNPILDRGGAKADVVEMIMDLSTAKIRRMVQRPTIGNFLVTLYMKDAPEVVKARYGSMLDTSAIYRKFFRECLDENMLRPDMDFDTAIKLLEWTCEGFSNELIAQVDSLRVSEEKYLELNEDLRRYLNILKKALFKEEV